MTAPRSGPEGALRPPARTLVPLAPELEVLRKSLLSDPHLLKRVEDVERSRRDGRPDAPRVTTPRALIGEQRGFALAVLSGTFSEVNSGERFVRGLPALGRLSPEVGDRIYRAIPYLWLTAIHPIALSHALPRHVVSPTLPHPLMWWSFEGALPYMVDGRKVGVIDAVLVTQEPGAIGFHAFGNTLDGTAISHLGVVRIGSRFPDEVPPSVHQWLGLIAFVNSPFIETKRELTHRPGAKVKWHGRRIGDPMAINVVALRSSIREAVAVERGEGPHWKSRWLVRGHYRAQWYPSIQAHKVVWIAPYLKGPEGAPLETQTYKVVR